MSWAYVFISKLDFRQSKAKQAKIWSSSKWKNKTIFPTSSSSRFQKCKNFWKKFVFWKNLAKKTSKKARNLSNFLFKKVGVMCNELHQSLKQNMPSSAKLEIDQNFWKHKLSQFEWTDPRQNTATSCGVFTYIVTSVGIRRQAQRKALEATTFGQKNFFCSDFFKNDPKLLKNSPFLNCKHF